MYSPSQIFLGGENELILLLRVLHPTALCGRAIGTLTGGCRTGPGIAGSRGAVLESCGQAQLVSHSLGQTRSPVANPSMARQPHQAVVTLFTYRELLWNE